MTNLNPAPFDILTINCGSSSLKFSIHCLGDAESRTLSGACEGIGNEHGRFFVEDEAGNLLIERQRALADHAEAVTLFLEWLRRHPCGWALDGVGHRVVHGGLRYTRPALITPEMLTDLGQLGRVDPEHLAHELKAIRLVGEAFPHLPQVACFDTAFHSRMPLVAQIHPLPREFHQQGLVRFGFHGLACESVMEELSRRGDDSGAKGRIVLAHLGSTASMTAVYQGLGIDTTMGFRANGGLMMGSRSGDLGPGVLLDLLLEKGLSPQEVNEIVNFRSGLLGVSGLSADMEELLKAAPSHAGAAQAIELFCYIAKKHLGSLVAALGGLDTLVFSGGIGANAPSIRERICRGMEFLGFELNRERNERNDPVITADGSLVRIQVVKVNEELTIARAAAQILRAHRLTEQSEDWALRSSGISEA